MRWIESALSSARPYFTTRNVLIGAALLLLAAAAFFMLRTMGAFLSPTMIRSMLAQLGVVGPLALIASLAGVLVIPVIPATVFQIGAGLAFGPWMGLLYATVADILGASIGFWAGRGWGRTVLEQRLSPDSHARLVALTRRMNWHTVVLLRLLPGPAYPLVSLAAGHSHLSYLSYMSASLTGVLPILALLVLAGNLIEDSPWLAVILVILIIGSLMVAGRLIGARAEQPQHP